MSLLRRASKGFEADTFDMSNLEEELIPEEVRVALDKTRKSTKGKSLRSVEIKLPPARYATVGGFMLGDALVEIASIAGAVPAFGPKRTEHFMRFAEAIAATGQLATKSLDLESQDLKDVTIKTAAAGRDGVFVYVPKGRLRLRIGDMVSSAFTVGRRLLGPEDPVVSFTQSSEPRADEDYYAAGTEMAQNRLFVISVNGDGVPSGDSRRHTEPFQESLANGLGNMFGAVALGRSYPSYREELEKYNAICGIWGSEINGQHLVAPNVYFDADCYKQLVDGGLPGSDFRVHAMRPVGTLQAPS